MLKFLHRTAILLFWPALLLIAWGELTPRPPALDSVFGWDKAQHFIAYFGLAVMATLGMGLRPPLTWAIAGLIGFGGAVEILQAYTGRDPEWLDFTANSLGVFAGLGLAAAFLLALRPRPLVGATPSD